MNSSRAPGLRAARSHAALTRGVRCYARGMRRFVAVVSLGAIVVTTSRGLATEPAPVVITMGGHARLRVQVSEGLTMPCDSQNNRALFDGRLSPGETFRASIGGECVCVRHTTSPFRDVDWTSPGLACRKRVCRGRICRPAPDPAIRVSLP